MSLGQMLSCKQFLATPMCRTLSFNYKRCEELSTVHFLSEDFAKYGGAVLRSGDSDTLIPCFFLMHQPRSTTSLFQCCQSVNGVQVGVGFSHFPTTPISVELASKRS